MSCAASRIIDLIDRGLPDRPEPHQELRHIRRGEELAAALSGVRGIHGHQILIGIPEGIDIVVRHRADIHARRSEFISCHHKIHKIHVPDPVSFLQNKVCRHQVFGIIIPDLF